MANVYDSRTRIKRPAGFLGWALTQTRRTDVVGYVARSVADEAARTGRVRMSAFALRERLLLGGALDVHHEMLTLTERAYEEARTPRAAP